MRPLKHISEGLKTLTRGKLSSKSLLGESQPTKGISLFSPMTENHTQLHETNISNISQPRPTYKSQIDQSEVHIINVRKQEENLASVQLDSKESQPHEKEISP